MSHFFSFALEEDQIHCVAHCTRLRSIALFGQMCPFIDRYGDPEQPLGPEYDVYSNDFMFDLRSIIPDKLDQTIE